MRRYIEIIIFISIILILSSCISSGKETIEPPATVKELTVPSINFESEAFFQEGYKFYQSSEIDLAITAYNKALAADENNYKALAGKGIALARKGYTTSRKQDIQEGITLIQQSLSISPDYLPSFYDLAVSYKLNQQYDEAIDCFQKIIVRETDNTWSYYEIASIYSSKGETYKAIKYLKKAAALDRTSIKNAAQSDPDFDKIRNTSEFKLFIEK